MGFQHPQDLDEEAKFLDKSRAADFQREFERGGVGKGRAGGCGYDMLRLGVAIGTWGLVHGKSANHIDE